MKLRKREMEAAYLALSETKPTLAQARARDAFVKPLMAEIDQYHKDRSAIYQEYCEKDEDGKPKVDDGKYHFANSDIEKINAELLTLANEEVEIEAKSPEALKELVENTGYSPKPGEAEAIDALIAAL